MPASASKGYLRRRARNSPSIFQVLPSGSSASPTQRNESGEISVKPQRIGVLSKRAPIWTISVPTFRPVWRSSWPVTGLIHRITRTKSVAYECSAPS